MRLSKMTYDAAMEEVAAEPCYADLLAWLDHRDEALRQPEKDFEKLYFKDAPAARKTMLDAVAKEWEPEKPGSAMQRPVRGTALPALAGSREQVQEALDRAADSFQGLSGTAYAWTNAVPLSLRTCRTMAVYPGDFPLLTRGPAARVRDLAAALREPPPPPPAYPPAAGPAAAAAAAAAARPPPARPP
mgnify:CR=1 FL=1